MMRTACIAIAIVLFLPTVVSAKITLFTFDNDRGEIWTTGNIVTRYENWDWFQPSRQVNDNNDYDYYWIRSRLGFGFTLKRIEAFLEIQDTHMWDLPNNAGASPPAGALGLGAIYYAHRRNGNSHGTFVNQGYIGLKDVFIDGLSLKGGRFNYADGLEVTYDDPKIMWLKKLRLSQRLIGPFGWSAFGRSFDGGQIRLDRELFNVTTMASHPREGGFENDGNHHIDDIDLVSATLTLKHDKVIPHTENRFFYIFYNDDRKMNKVDNTPAGSGLNSGNIELHTMGLHWLSALDLGPGVGDFLVWGTGQWGDWGTLTHQAWAWAAEIGYQFTDVPAKPWLRIGYFQSSGDSSPADSAHETFFQILPTARLYAFTPFYNLMNNRDFFIQLLLKPIPKMVVRTDFHFLQLNERGDRWYMGAGATRDRGNIFGYIGRPSFGDTDLANVLDFTIAYDFNQHINLNAYYGHAWGDDVIENIYSRDDDANFFYFEMKLKF
jgi:hypothetical protein